MIIEVKEDSFYIETKDIRFLQVVNNKKDEAHVNGWLDVVRLQIMFNDGTDIRQNFDSIEQRQEAIEAIKVAINGGK